MSFWLDNMRVGVLRIKNAGIYRLGVRQPSDAICHSSTTARVGLPSKPLARAVVGRRRRDRCGAGNRRCCHEAHTSLDRGKHAGRSDCARGRTGFGESSSIRAPPDRVMRPIWQRRGVATRCPLDIGRAAVK